MEIQFKKGNEELLRRKKTAFLCSQKTPCGVREAIEEWLGGLSASSDCVMCGDQSPMEKLVFERLLGDKIPAVLVLAEAMHDRWSEAVSQALAENRLLIITHCDGNVHFVTARSAADRNLLMLSLADDTVVGFCTGGGRLERVLAGFDNVTFLFGKEPDKERSAPAEVTPCRKESSGISPDENYSWMMESECGGGNVAVRICTVGEESFIEISRAVAIWNEGYGEKIMLTKVEFYDFYRGMRTMIENFDASEPGRKGFTVKSDCGDMIVTFQLENDADSFVMMQRKVFADNALNYNSVIVALPDIPRFYEILSSAVLHGQL